MPNKYLEIVRSARANGTGMPASGHPYEINEFNEITTPAHDPRREAAIRGRRELGLRYPESDKPTLDEIEEAIEAVERVGYCLMYSTILRQRFVICRDDESNALIAHDVPIFTIAELAHLFGNGRKPKASTLRLIFEAKREAGARVLGVHYHAHAKEGP